MSSRQAPGSRHPRPRPTSPRTYRRGSTDAYHLTRTSNHSSRPWRSTPLYSRLAEDPEPEPITFHRQVYVTSERKSPRRETREAPIAYAPPAAEDDEDERDILEESVPITHLPRRESEWIDPEDDVHFAPDNDVVDADAYRQFGLNWLADLDPSSRDGDSSDVDAASDDKTISTQDELTAKGSKGVQAYGSHYTGTADTGGDHSASITVLHDPQHQIRPLFRWLHVPQTIMNFEKFWEEVSLQKGFSEDEKAALVKLRGHLRKNFIKARYNLKGEKVGYMVPRVVAFPIASYREEKEKDAAKPSPSPQQFVKWVCLEYFSLAKYSGLAAASNQALFPSQTLLQAHYSRTTRQRDMEQAVRLLGNTSSDECFHVEQLWALVLNNHLITCGTMSQHELQGDVITTTSEPMRELTPALGRILVSLASSAHWVFSPAECPTWFDFISHFRDFWPQDMVFKHRNKQVQPENWPKLVKMAERSRSPLVITLSLEPAAPLSTRIVLNPLSTGGADSNSLDIKVPPSGSPTPNIHVLTLLPSIEMSQNSINKVEDQLKGLEKFIDQQCPYSDSKAYKTCDVATRVEVHNHLAAMAPKVDRLDDRSIRTLYEEAIELYNYAEAVFELFLPLSYDGPTTRKFWGAVKLLTQIPELDINYTGVTSARSVADIRLFLRNLAVDIEQFQKIMKHASQEQRMCLKPNRELVTAWLHVLSALVGPASWFGHVEQAEALIAEGLEKMIRSTSDIELQSKVAVMPAELWSLISIRLLGNQGGGSDDVVETYSQYLSSLDTNIRDKPSDRSLQRSIDLVQQEIGVIKNTLNNQQDIISTLRASGRGKLHTRIYHRSGEAEHHVPSRPHRQIAHRYDRYDRYERSGDPFTGPSGDTKPGFGLRSNFPVDLNALFLADCRAIIEQRLDEFRKYGWYADDLGKAIANKVDWTKDRQENAIYAFTIVTIVFLPISAVSSIFGMNTSDVRDMDQGQWLYWAVALPVTFGVIVGGLWWMSELDAVVRWFTGGGLSRRQMRRMPVPAGMVEEDELQPLSARAEGSSRVVKVEEAASPSRRRRRSASAYYSSDDDDWDVRGPAVSASRPAYRTVPVYRQRSRRI